MSNKKKKFLLDDDQPFIGNIAKEKNGFFGTLRNIQLSDLIQMCCLSVVSMAILVTKDELEGMIYIQQGEIVHAFCGDINGEEAFYTIMGWKTGSFETQDASPGSMVSIKKNWQSLLIEALRRIDEKETGKVLLEKINTQKKKAEIHAAPHEQIGVLIVDDSPMMFKVLENMFNKDKHIKVLGRAANGAEALKKVDELRPHVITLDVNMPVMDGGTALKHIMLKNPCPVIIISSIADDSQSHIIDFLRLGAIDFVAKPVQGLNMDDYERYLISLVRRVSKAKTDNFKRVKSHKLLPDKKKPQKELFSCQDLLIIKSGYGGYAEIMRIIPQLPDMRYSSILIFQAAPPELLCHLSEYLDKRSLPHVFSLNHKKDNRKEYKLGGGGCYICSENILLSIVEKNSGCFMEVDAIKDIKRPLFKDYPFNHCMLSVAKAFSGRVQVVFLSGSELESVKGIQKIREKGGRVIVQTPESSLVPSSLKKIINQGIVDITADPNKIAEIIH